MWPNPQETAELVTFTENICDRKLQFLCAVGVISETYNHAHNILKLVDILPNISFSTSETKHDY